MYCRVGKSLVKCRNQELLVNIDLSTFVQLSE